MAWRVAAAAVFAALRSALGGAHWTCVNSEMSQNAGQAEPVFITGRKSIRCATAARIDHEGDEEEERDEALDLLGGGQEYCEGSEDKCGLQLRGRRAAGKQ